MRRKHSSRSIFKNTYNVLFTPRLGYLYAVKYIEGLPGDSYSIDTAPITRLAPMLAPFFGRMQVKVFCIKDALRNLHANFDDFRTGGPNNQDTTVAPYVLCNATNSPIGSLADMLGVPVRQFYTPNAETGVLEANDQVLKVSALPFRAYAKFVNEWVIKEHVQEELPFSTADGYDTTTNMDLARIGWGHDRFTDALPAQQLGPAIQIPLGSTAPVIGNGDKLMFGTTTDVATSDEGYNLIGASTGSGNVFMSTSMPAGNANVRLTYPTDPTKSGLVADLSLAASVTVPQFELARKMNTVAMKLMMFGSRMTEWLASFWGVKADDGRLQHSEYVGGYTQDIMVSAVEQTSSTDNTSPQGNLAGRGYAGGIGKRFNFSFKEDGCAIIFMAIRPLTQYAQGLPRYLTRFTRMDYALPAFQHLPMEPIYQKELFATGIENGTSASDWDDATLDDNKVFGYQPMFQDYRKQFSTVHGDFLDSMSYWTTYRLFENAPQLNSDFIEANPPTRMFAVTGDDATVALTNFQISQTVRRKLSKFGYPRS